MNFVFIPTIILTLMLNFFPSSVDCMTPTTYDKLDKFIEEYSSDISESEKNRLLELKDKMEIHDALTQEEVDFIRDCQTNAFRNKLGDAKYQEYCKLIEKMESDAEFTQPEKFRLYELLKELKS